MADKTCSSADKVLEVFLENAPMDTSHHRMVKQQNKCGYGLQGICCRLCSNGPCRLSPAKPKGVCGADADTIACRNFLRQVAAGSGCYTHVVENTARRLKEMAQELQAEGKKPKYKDSVAKLAKILQINCCGNCGSDCHNSCAKTAEMIADAVLADIRKPYDEKMTLMKNIALPKRYELWEKLGILPGGAKDEIFNAVVKTSTNLNSDPMDMLLQCLRLGISTGNYGLILTNLMNDIIMGPPQISMDPVGFRIIDPEYINIMITGHQQSMFADLEEKLESEIVQKSAELVGAKGIRIVGCTCVGQDYQARSGCYKDVYCGHAGNNYTSEAVLMTGCVDLVVSEFNCTIPGIEPICDQLDIKMLCLDDVAKKANAQLLPYTAEEKEKMEITNNLSELDQMSAQELVEAAKKGIKADFNGVITKVSVVEGATTALGTELFILQNTDKINVNVNVSKYDYDKLKEGQSADITLAGKTYEGEVTSISHVATQNEKGASLISADVRIKNPDDDIFLGVDAKVTIHAEEADDVVVLPSEVVNIGKDGSFCYVIENGVITRRDITTGISSDDYVEVTEGIKEGDEVIRDLGSLEEGMQAEATLFESADNGSQSNLTDAEEGA